MINKDVPQVSEIVTTVESMLKPLYDTPVSKQIKSILNDIKWTLIYYFDDGISPLSTTTDNARAIKRQATAEELCCIGVSTKLHAQRLEQYVNKMSILDNSFVEFVVTTVRNVSKSIQNYCDSLIALYFEIK